MVPDAVKVTLGATPYLCTVEAGPHTFLVDEPTAVGGGDVAPQPGYLLLTSLASCTAITVKMYANRKGWPLESIEVSARFNSEDKPTPQTTVIESQIRFIGPLDAEQRLRLMQIANACPVHKLLANPIQLITTQAL